MQFSSHKNIPPLRTNARKQIRSSGGNSAFHPQTMSRKLRRGPRWVLSTSRRCAARRQVTFFFFFVATKSPAAAACRRCLGKFIAGRAQRQGPWHRADATGGIRSNFSCRGGCPPSFSLLKLLSNPCQQSNLSWCPCAPKPRMSLHSGQMHTCFSVWPSPQ